MKLNLYLLLSILSLLSFDLKAQAPNEINYQGVARNSSGAVLKDQLIGLEFTIHQGSASGTIVYQETQTDSTDQFGLFSVAIGTGTVKSGSFASISWGTNSEYLQVGMDPTGGSTYADMGAEQFLSVPYSFYAATSGNSTNSVTGTAPMVITGTATAPIINIQGTAANKGGILYSTGAGTSASFNATGTTGQVLQSNGTAAPSWVTSPSSTSGWLLTGNSIAYTFSSKPGTYVGTASSGGAGFQFGIGGNNAGRIESTNQNTAIGYLSMNSNNTTTNTSTKNTAVGFIALYSNIAQSDNIAIGDSAIYTQNYSSAFSSNNVALGNSALFKNNPTSSSSGYQNTAVGNSSLKTNTIGYDNTALGYDADVTSGALSYATAIGAGAKAGQSNSLILGGASGTSSAVNVGIGTATPNSTFQVSGGNISLPIKVSATSVNLSTSPSAYTVIITATGQTVTLPTASTCAGRIYNIIAQMASGSITIGSYQNFNGVSTTSIPAGNSIIIQSDGTNWDQIK